MPSAPTSLSPETIAEAQRDFAAALPKMRAVMRFRLRGVRGERKDELIAEATALAWANYLQVLRDGRDPEPLISKMAHFAAMHAYRGGHLAGQERINDAMSRTAKDKRGVRVQALPFSDEEEVHPELLSALRDHREASPADEAASRIDHEERRKLWTDREREIADEMQAGFNTADVARKRGVSRTRIWQQREDMKAKAEQGEGRGG